MPIDGRFDGEDSKCNSPGDQDVTAKHNPQPLARRLLAEGLGSGLLAATVVGSGIMAQRLSGGNAAVALLANTGATVAVLYTLIMLLGPVSGAHFNPAVSGIQALRRRLSWRDAGAYTLIQIAGCCAGAMLAHLMFELPVVQASTHVRTGPAQWLAETVATFGLLLVVIGHRRAEQAPWMVAGWIGAAYWFTASTSFANPAITVARSLSNTFCGIRPVDAPGFIVAQLIGAIAAFGVSQLLFPAPRAAAVPAVAPLRAQDTEAARV
jgi:glycerol uptake facilitator-like aquaporin